MNDMFNEGYDAGVKDTKKRSLDTLEVMQAVLDLQMAAQGQTLSAPLMAAINELARLATNKELRS